MPPFQVLLFFLIFTNSCYFKYILKFFPHNVLPVLITFLLVSFWHIRHHSYHNTGQNPVNVFYKPSTYNSVFLLSTHSTEYLDHTFYHLVIDSLLQSMFIPNHLIFIAIEFVSFPWQQNLWASKLQKEHLNSVSHKSVPRFF